MCPPMWAHLRHMANTIELVLPSAHPSPQRKRQIDQFSRFLAFVNRFTLCYRPTCLFCLSVCDVGRLWPNGWMDHYETWHECRPRPDHIVLHVYPAPLTQRGTAPNFRPMSVVAKRLDGPRCQLVGRWPRPRPHCIRWGPSPPPPKKKIGAHPA